MRKQGLGRAGVPYQAKAATACIHVAGRQTQITELLRSGEFLVAARELARHNDIRMTMRYIDVGLDDQARAGAAFSHLVARRSVWNGRTREHHFSPGALCCA